ncbi:HAD family hydrolase [Salinispora arenicola]|uniref:HAD family hydrolase n=1 Tax=Salinispora arenicola TaxID=168697 RepID=UPI0009B77DDC|nr:HAD hydrolase family protein [Salinispora arenicola]
MAILDLREIEWSSCTIGAGGMPRAVVTDLDGTLLRSDGSLSMRTISGIHRAVAEDLLVVYATARPAASALTVLADLPQSGFLVSSNGATTMRLSDRRLTRVRAIPWKVAQQVVMAIDRDCLGAFWAADCFAGRFTSRSWPGGLASDAAGRPRIVNRVPVGNDVLCLMVLGDVESVANVLGFRFPIRMTSSSSGLLEISNANADKLEAVDVILRERGLDWADVLSFGDAPNDNSFLRASRWSFAMGNAHESTVQAAYYRTATNNEDGVARVLERLSEGLSGR